jgi:hypothetical protein
MPGGHFGQKYQGSGVIRREDAGAWASSSAAG